MLLLLLLLLHYLPMTAEHAANKKADAVLTTTAYNASQINSMNDE
jgi:hypothetical protein